MNRQRVLILRPDNIGDAVLFSGALKCLRAHWPRARLHICVSPATRPLYAHCPYVDRVLGVYRLMPWLYLRRLRARGTWALERTMKRNAIRCGWYPRYDTVIYPVSAPKEPFLEAVRLMSTKEKWGVGGVQLNYQSLNDVRNEPERVFTRYWRNEPGNLWMHELERTALFLEAMGVVADDVSPELWLSVRDRKAAERLIPRPGVLGCFIGAAHPTRRWPIAKWASLIMAQDVAEEVVLLGGRQDVGIAEEIVKELGQATTRISVRSLCGRTKLRELAACMFRCGACVSNDSAGLHMAVAAGIPTVGLLGGYHFGRFYPWGDPTLHRVAQVGMDCYYCNAVCRYGDFRCVSDIAVSDVVAELRSAFASAGKHGRYVE